MSSSSASLSIRSKSRMTSAEWSRVVSRENAARMPLYTSASMSRALSRLRAPLFPSWLSGSAMEGRILVAVAAVAVSCTSSSSSRMSSVGSSESLSTTTLP